MKTLLQVSHSLAVLLTVVIVLKITDVLVAEDVQLKNEVNNPYTTLKVFWKDSNPSKNGFSNLLNDSIRITNINSGDMKLKEVASSIGLNRNDEITGLVPGESYKVEVIIIRGNKNTTSNFSNIISTCKYLNYHFKHISYNFITDSPKPQNLFLKSANSSNALIVKWNIDFTIFKYLNYTLELFNIDSGDKIEYAINDTTSDMTKTVNGLSPGAEYNATVFLVNKDGIESRSWSNVSIKTSEFPYGGIL